MGVLTELPPLTEPVGVDAEGSVEPFAFEACFAAFSARRFCLEAEGAMVVGGEGSGLSMPSGARGLKLLGGVPMCSCP